MIASAYRCSPSERHQIVRQVASLSSWQQFQPAQEQSSQRQFLVPTSAQPTFLVLDIALPYTKLYVSFLALGLSLPWCTGVGALLRFKLYKTYFKTC